MTTLDDWTTALAQELGITHADIDTRALLDLAGTAAHSVDRPAAPLTTYLVGVAAAQRGGTPDALRDAIAVATALAQQWPSRATAGDATSPDPPA